MEKEACRVQRGAIKLSLRPFSNSLQLSPGCLVGVGGGDQKIQAFVFSFPAPLAFCLLPQSQSATTSFPDERVCESFWLESPGLSFQSGILPALAASKGSSDRLYSKPCFFGVVFVF